MTQGRSIFRRALRCAAATVLVALAAGTARAFGAVRPAAPPGADGFTLVVHAANPATSLTVEQASKIFLRKQRTWAGGEAVVPVEPSDKSPARRDFSKRVLGKDVAAMRGYWQQMIFTGKGVPPLEKGTESEVLAYVAATPGAIGYVSPGAALPSGVKQVALQR